jgi:uncharacterized protein YdeI (YjbR/CyaY-like superfamily)
MTAPVPATASEHPATWNFDYEVFHAETLRDLRAWLAVRHSGSPGMWFASWKSHTGRPAVPYATLVEELVCWGWIDSTINTLDEQRLLQLCTPRKPRSTWTRLNRDRVRRMDEAGRMQPAGWAAVEVAKRNGWWTIYDPVEDLVVPDDLRSALDARPVAAAFFDDEVPPSAKKAMLWQVYSAVRPATRDKRIATIVREAAAGRRAFVP